MPPPDAPPAAEGEIPLFSVDQAINACLMADPQIKAGLEAIRQANGDWIQSSLKPNPWFNISQTLNPLEHWTPTRQGGPPQFDTGIAMPIDWYLFGKQAAAMLAAQQGVRVSESQYADVIRVRVMQTSMAYFDALEAQAMLELARENLQNLTEVEEAQAKLVREGLRADVDLKRIRLDVLAGRRLVNTATVDATQTKAALETFLGGMRITQASLSPNLPGPLPVEVVEVDQAYQMAQGIRPDIQALRWQVAQARAVIELEVRNGKPLVTPKVGYTHQFQNVIGFPDANSWGVGVDMSLPVFNQNQGNVHKAMAVANQAAFAVRNAEIALHSELESATQEIRTAVLNSATVAESQLQLAGQVRDAITAAYNAGDRPLIDLLDAQRNYRETYRLYITARAGFWRAFYRYNAAIGQQVLIHDAGQDPTGPGG
ncbi:MAG: TolC family protein [Planctomycetaceae bacterium]